uniref:Uncharacterized protein n=1 Tax=Pararge aegeria TaxID=116150 RepID=S4PWP0_9NEOP
MSYFYPILSCNMSLVRSYAKIFHIVTYDVISAGSRRIDIDRFGLASQPHVTLRYNITVLHNLPILFYAITS